MRNWGKVTDRVNDEFDVDFQQEKIRKGWRTYGKKEDKIDVSDSVNQSSFEQNINIAEASTKGKRVKTLEDLEIECEIDKDVWKVDRWSSNKWEVGAKDKGTGEIRIEPLYQIKAWLTKYIPDKTVFPVIAPIQVSLPDNTGEVNVVGKSELKCALVIPDSQIGYKRDIDTGKLVPFHDRKAINLTVQIASFLKPDRIIFLGDMIDLPDWTDKFLKSPEFYWTTQPSLIELSYWIACLRSIVPKAEIDYIEGNHENRMNKSIISNLIAAYNLRPTNGMDHYPAMSIPSLLGLKDLNVNYYDNYPKDEVWINNNLRCRHGSIAKKGGGSTSKAVLKDIFISEIYGHSHRFEYSCKTVRTSKGTETFRIFSPGTLAKIDGSVPSNASQEDWQQGLGLVYYGKYDFDIVPISINDGKCIMNNMILEGKDYTKELVDSTGWKFF
jgi:hypothetical protein